jgi:hypothetical protein
MSVTAVPALSVAGSTIATGNVGDLVAVDAVSLPWGRGDLLSHPTPATAAVSLLDRGTGLPTASRRDLIGQPVTLSWSTGTAAGTSFRGRITDVEVDWLPTQRAARLSLACSSKEVDAGNYTAPAGSSWPAESFAARLARIVSLLPPGLFAGGVVMPDAGKVTASGLAPRTFTGYTAAAADVSGADVLSLLRELWFSCYPSPLVYDPSADRLTYAGRRFYSSPGTSTARLVTSSHYGGRYIAVPLTAFFGALGLHLDAAVLEGSDPVSQPIDSRLTRVEVSYPGAGAAGTATAVPFGAPSEATTGRRMLSVSSVHAVAADAASLAADWADLAGREAAAPRLGPVTYDTARAPFPDDATAGALLACSESSLQSFLAATWLPRVGVSPLVGFTGGRLSYAAGHWRAQLSPAASASVTPPTPVTAITAGDFLSDVKLADVDPSVTFGDLAYISAR